MGKCQSIDLSRREPMGENSLQEPMVGNKKRNRHLESMARVGSRVFMPESRASPTKSNTNTTLKEHKASTYDHVHELSMMGLILMTTAPVKLD